MNPPHTAVTGGSTIAGRSQRAGLRMTIRNHTRPIGTRPQPGCRDPKIYHTDRSGADYHPLRPPTQA